MKFMDNHITVSLLICILFVGILGCLMSSLMGDPVIIRRESRSKRYIILWLIIRVISYFIIDMSCSLLLLNNESNEQLYTILLLFFIISIIGLQIFAVFDYISHIKKDILNK